MLRIQEIYSCLSNELIWLVPLANMHFVFLTAFEYLVVTMVMFLLTYFLDQGLPGRCLYYSEVFLIGWF